MGGLREFITTNQTIFATSPTEDTLLDALTPMFDFNKSESGDTRLGFCGNGWLNNFQKLIRDSSGVRINYEKVGKSVYGMNFNEFVFPQGRILLKSHPLMSRHGRYTNSAFFLDPASLIYRPLRGRDTKFEDNIQTPGKDSHEGQWVTEAGIEVDGEFTCGYIGNFVI